VTGHVEFDQLRELMEVSALVTSSLDSKEIRRRSVEAAPRLVNAERASLLLIDKRGKELYFEVALGEEGEKLGRIRIVPGEGVAGSVLQSCTPIIINDVASDQRHLHTVDEATGFTTRSILAVPLRCKGQSLGVLEVLNKLEGEFTPTDVEVISSLANQIAVAVENADLYHRLRRAYIETWIYSAIFALAFVGLGILIIR
jgi:Nif-specific regulatory protein